MRLLVRVVCLLAAIGFANLVAQVHMLDHTIKVVRLGGVHFNNTVSGVADRLSHVVDQIGVEGDVFSILTSSGHDDRQHNVSQPPQNGNSTFTSFIYYGTEQLWGAARVCVSSVTHTYDGFMGQRASLITFCTLIALVFLYFLLSTYCRTTRADVWDDVAKTEFFLGDLPTTRGVHMRHERMINAINSESWRESLYTFFTWIRVDTTWLDHIRSRAERRQARRHADQEMLRHRDIIFAVRNNVFTKVSKEAVRKHTESNRLIIARHVEEAFVKMTISDTVRHRIREACINACFIDTMYDRAGQDILPLGPPRRPV